ncbi:MAG: sigma 54-interacting transcriptional regulator [Oscillibacter sp.]|jgi:transcriptional regulator with PAS, ATPase and Fis domain|nr:sigma 54-interacting transcriptional regulator [Oscillibacter sp.]
MPTRKKISVIALDPRAGASYKSDIEKLFADVADISVFSMLDGSAAGTLDRADLFVASTDAYGSPEELMRHIPIDSQTMAVEVSFRWSELRKLKALPAGSRVLFVNMTQTMAREAIAQLEQFGITHVHWIPFYPGAPEVPEARIAVTPDELRYVPPEMETVIDLGQRVCTSGMMIEVALRLGLEHLLEGPAFQRYAQDVATSNYSFDRMFARSIRLESQFHILMESLEDGVVGVNEKGEIFACSRHAEEMTLVSAPLVQGRRCEEVFPYIPFVQCMQGRRSLPAKAVKVGGVNLSVEVVPVIRQNACIGAFALLQRFNDVEARQSELRSQLFHKGHYAKYSFDDVVGRSEAIRKTKETLGRMARSESPVLLIGETGTGKELFAHAVHQASRRAEGPFVAINVAAFPENLLESELFGYEEGAFTGAKKGGRPGLFELAHRGTLFLDEVEGMSSALQIKLLRALQEREVMRVGGHRIIHVDVRIVAATNESLEQKVREGSFRRDLYYRLSTLPALIPPLTERGDDMFLLTERFRQELGGAFRLTEPVKAFFRRHPWPGNIRELRNAVEYFIYTGHEDIGLEDLPPTLFLSEGTVPRPVGPPPPETGPSDAFRFILSRLYAASEAGASMGRETLLKQAREAHVPLSQREVRDILTDMAAQGLARVSRGRGGSQLTPKGRALWETGQS